MTSDQDIMTSLRNEFLTDPEGVFDQFLDAMSLMRSDIGRGILGIMKVFHSLKGTSQAIGFKHFAEFINSAESALTQLQHAAPLNELSEQDSLRLENLLGTCVQACEKMFHGLRAGAPDGEALVSDYLPSLRDLENWKPGVDEGDWGMGETSGARVPPPPPPPAPAPAPAPAPQTDAVPMPQAVAPVSVATPVVLKPVALPAASLTPKEAVSRGARKGQFLLLQQKERMFGVPLGAVVEILEHRPWCTLPVKRRGVLGVMNRFGDVLPVIDFQGLLGVRGKADVDLTRQTIVVCSASGRRFGFPVDNVSQIVELKPTDLQPASQIEIRRHNGIVTDMAILGSKMLLIVDLNKLIE